MKEKLFTKQQVADYLEVSVRTVDRLFDDIKFPVYHIGHQVRIPQSSVDMILEKSLSSEKLVKIVNKILEV